MYGEVQMFFWLGNLVDLLKILIRANIKLY